MAVTRPRPSSWRRPGGNARGVRSLRSPPARCAAWRCAP